MGLEDGSGSWINFWEDEAISVGIVYTLKSFMYTGYGVLERGALYGKI